MVKMCSRFIKSKQSVQNRGGNEMGIIVALDIGVASVGWAVLDMDKEEILEAGSNIFPEATAEKIKQKNPFRDFKCIHYAVGYTNDLSKLLFELAV